MKIVTYNTHYAIGKDDQYDLDRIAASVQGADIIALQEVERNYGPPDQPSQPEDIASLFPHYYWVFDAAFDIDGCERNPDGTVLNRRRQHGQMLLSRWPILSKRYFPLPRLHIDPEFNMQMGVLEAVLDTPTGALRIYNMHFGSVASEERLRQANFILELVRDAPSQGGAWTGSACESPDRDWSAEMTQPPMPESALVLGDFNMQPNSPEYAVLSTAANENNGPLLTEIWTALNPGRNVLTWHPNSSRPGNEKAARLDYCFGTPDLAKRAMSSWVDQEAEGSDHQPLWIKLEACP